MTVLPASDDEARRRLLAGPFGRALSTAVQRVHGRARWRRGFGENLPHRIQASVPLEARRSVHRLRADLARAKLEGELDDE